MEIKSGSKTEENNFEMKLSDFEPKSEANNNQNNTEPNCPKKHLEKDEEIKTKKGKKSISTKKKKKRRLLISLQAKKNAKKT